MTFTYFSRNGNILPIEDAQVSLSSVEYSYGYGVYETIRVTKGKAHFVEQHCERLMNSAEAIELDHSFNSKQIEKYILNLLSELKVEACNLKVLLIGGAEPLLLILPLNPLFPDRKLYKTGAHAITYKYERLFPHAKTLNMLPSYLAYRDARKAGAYDALLINSKGCVTEGTRTNFFAIKDKNIYSPPESEILLGVTRDNVLKAAKDQGYKLIEQAMPLDSLKDYEGVFITSTTCKIMPLTSIDNRHWDIPDTLRELMSAFNQYLND